MATEDDSQLKTIEVDGQYYDVETVCMAILDAIIGRAPVAVMSNQSLYDGIGNRISWALGAVSLIASHDDTDDCIAYTADAAVLHLEQARAMFRALTDRRAKT